VRAAVVIGVGETRHAPRRDDVTTTELAWEAVSAALADADVELDEIDNAVTASQDFWEGRTISSMAVNEVVAGYLRPEAKVAADGAQAVMYAWSRIAGETYRLGLVVAHCKESAADPHEVDLAAMDPFYLRDLGVDETVAAGLQAGLLGYPAELRAAIVAAAAARSPWRDPIDAAEVLASPETATPLRELERAPLADGACALVVCDADTAAARGREGVRIAGCGTSTDAYWTDRDLTAAPALAAARDAALAAAGWDGLPETVELAAPFAHQAIMWGGVLGLGEPERVVAHLAGERSPRGGWLGGPPGVVAGLSAAAGCVQALRQRPGRALAHGSTGILGQSHHVVCLEADA
jgi:acetyl-CoA C-acetyltransferase